MSESINLVCQCGKPGMYDKECRDCYEDRMRHERRDFLYYNNETTQKRMLAKERCQIQLRRRRRIGEEQE